MVVMLAAIKSAFDGTSIGEFRVWLNRIIDRRGIADFHRDREDDPPVGPLPTEHQGEEEIWGEEPAEADETGRVVVQSVIDECLEGLSEAHRDVIELNVFEDLDAQTTADRVNEKHPDLDPPMSQANVHKIVSRFRKCLTEKLEDERAERWPTTSRSCSPSTSPSTAPAARPTRSPTWTRADDADRPELAALIDGYLARSPGRDWDAEAYAGSAAERVADELGRSLLGRLRTVAGDPAAAPQPGAADPGPGGRAAERGARRRRARAEGRAPTTTRWSTAASTRAASPTGCSRRSARSTGRRRRSCARSASPSAAGRPPAGAPAPAMARTAMPDRSSTTVADRGRSPDPSRWRRRRRETRSTSCSRAALSGPSVCLRLGRQPCAASTRPSPHDLQAATRPFLLFRFALREGDFRLAELIARALWRGRRGRRAPRSRPG